MNFKYGVKSCHKPLCGRFLVAGRAVNLTCGIKTCDFFEFESGEYVESIDTVVLYRVSVAHNIAVFETLDAFIHRALNIVGHR